MAQELDRVTQRPIGTWRFSPPEIVVATNGYVLRTYDVANDEIRYEIAATAEEVGAALRRWGDTVAASIKAAVERELAKAIQ